MKDILKIVCFIEDEIEGACEYASKALWYKERNKSSIAQAFYEMSQQELKHMDKLHSIFEELLNDVADKPQMLMDVWECKHQALIDKAAGVKQKLSMFTH